MRLGVIDIGSNTVHLLVVDAHLDHEERDLEPVMIAHAGTEEWKGVEKQLRRQPPRVAGPFFAWVQDGMGAAERTYIDVDDTVKATLGDTRVKGSTRWRRSWAMRESWRSTLVRPAPRSA